MFSEFSFQFEECGCEHEEAAQVSAPYLLMFKKRNVTLQSGSREQVMSDTDKEAVLSGQAHVNP